MNFLVSCRLLVSSLHRIHFILYWAWRVVQVHHMRWPFVEDRAVVSAAAVLLLSLCVNFQLSAWTFLDILTLHMNTWCKMHMLLLRGKMSIFWFCSQVFVAIENSFSPFLNIFITNLLSKIVLNFILLNQLFSIDYYGSRWLINNFYCPFRCISIFFKGRLFGRWRSLVNLFGACMKI